VDLPLDVEEIQTSPTLRNLIHSCWEDDPSQRPSFASILAGHTFSHILLDTTVTDPAARDFWAKYFILYTDKGPTWPTFWSCLVSHFNLTPSDQGDLSLRFRSALLSRSIDDRVTAKDLHNFCEYFGPFEPAMLQRFYEWAIFPAFHGDLAMKKAEELLRKSNNSNGSWLVRYATRPGDFRVSVIPYKLTRQVSFKHYIISNCSPYRGSFVWLRAPKGSSLRQSVESDRQKMLLLSGLKQYSSIKELIKDNAKQMGIRYNRYVDAYSTTFIENGSTWWGTPRVGVAAPALAKTESTKTLG
jgi:hypothetical protein